MRQNVLRNAAVYHKMWLFYKIKFKKLLHLGRLLQIAPLLQNVAQQSSTVARSGLVLINKNISFAVCATLNGFGKKRKIKMKTNSAHQPTDKHF